MNSLLKNEVIDRIMDPIRAALTMQRVRAARHPDGTVRLVSVLVPNWYREAICAARGAEPMFLGCPIMVGPHEEVKIVWWDPTMALDAGVAV